MRIDVQRKIDQIVGVIICRILSLFYIPFNLRGKPSKVDKILVILLSEMGSLVMSSVMFARLKQRYPNASLYLLTFQRNKEVVDLIGRIPPQNIVTIDDASFLRFCLSTLRSLTHLRRQGIDTVIDCELFSRVSSLLSLVSGAGTRVGFYRYTQEGLFRGNFINRRVLYNPYLHISKQFTTLADAIDSDTVPAAKKRTPDHDVHLPRISFQKADIDGMLKRLKQQYAYSAARDLVLIYPSGGLISIRAWPAESYTQVAVNLLQAGYAVGIIGLKQDRPLAGLIEERCKSPHCMNLAGFTKTLEDLLILLNIASLLITNDGGPGHFAALARIPAIILFGPETPVLYGSLSPVAENVYRQVNCSPCLTAYNHRSTPCDGDNVCLKSIHPDEILKRALAVLSESSQSAMGPGQ